MKTKIVGCGVLDVPQSNQITRCSHRPATRIVSLILSLAMLFSITVGIDLSVFADEYVYGDWVYAKLQEPIEEKNGSAEIIGYNGSDSSVEIPSKISDGENDFDVISIGNDVFNGNSDIVVIKIALYLLLIAQKQPEGKRKQLLDAGDGCDKRALTAAMQSLKVCDPLWSFEIF